MPDDITNAGKVIEAPPNDNAFERMKTFARRFGVAHTALAMYSAFPIGLTSEIVHLIRINYVPTAPWIAEADLLLSPLCREAGGEFYEMDAEIRELLLDEFNSNERFGAAKLKDLAEFMLAYVSHARLMTQDRLTLDFLRAQELSALAYANPEEAARQLARAMRQGIEANDRSETLRIANLTQSLAAPLFAQGKALIYAAGIESLFERETERAMRLFGSIGATSEQANVGGIALPSAAEMAEKMKLADAPREVVLPYPFGFTLRATLRDHTDTINRIAWSPDGNQIASPSRDGKVFVTEADTGNSRLIEVESGEDLRQAAWSPDGERLASISDRGLVRIYNIRIGWQTPQMQRTEQGNCIAWSPDGKTLAWGTNSSTLWAEVNEDGIQAADSLGGEDDAVRAIAWSPDGSTLAVAASRFFIKFWKKDSGQQEAMLIGGDETITDLAWSPDGKTLASGSITGAVQIWDYETQSLRSVLRGHSGYVTSVSFSFDGHLLASKSDDGTVRLWRCDRWEQVAVLDEPYAAETVRSGLAFHPSQPRLATLDATGTAIRIWDLNFKALLGPETPAPSITYRNAKVVVVGDAGVGKSGLCIALTGQPFEETASTHALSVLTLDAREVNKRGGNIEVREILLWDLAAGPNYRIANQLYLDDASAVLIVIDLTGDRDFREEIEFWDRSLRQARRGDGSGQPPLRKFLIVARADRREPSEEQGIIGNLINEFVADEYFLVSAKEGTNIDPLAQAIRNAIRWDELPSVSAARPPRRNAAPDSFSPDEREGISLAANAKAIIGDFLRSALEDGRALFSRDELLSLALKRFESLINKDELTAHFDDWVKAAQSLGLVKRLVHGEQILLRTEIMDSVVGRIIETIRSQSSQDALLGCASESLLFSLEPNSQTIGSRGPEVFESVVADLISRKIAVRAQSDRRNLIVMPSLFLMDNQPEISESIGQEFSSFNFDGQARTVYATLLARLSHSKDFRPESLWRRDAIFLREDPVDNEQSQANAPPDSGYWNSDQARRKSLGCGIRLNEISEEHGRITIYFGQNVPDATRFLFEDRVRHHLREFASPQSVRRQRIFHCRNCGIMLDSNFPVVGIDTIAIQKCPNCNEVNSLLDRAESLARGLDLFEQETRNKPMIEEERERIVALLEKKLADNTFDVFLSYHPDDIDAVTNIALRLIARGIWPFFNIAELRHPFRREEALGSEINNIKAAALFMGSEGYSETQGAEFQILPHLIEAQKPVVSVILPGKKAHLRIHNLLQGIPPVDFRIADPDPIDELIRLISTPLPPSQAMPKDDEESYF